MLVSQRIDHPSGLTPNYLPNFTLLVEDKWACFFIELLAKNRVLGNKDYKAVAIIRKKWWGTCLPIFLKRMLCHQISFCFSFEILLHSLFYTGFF